MKLGESETVDISPLSPRFFEFFFTNSNSRFVLLEVTSNDTSCMTVSVQNASCPILDQENNVQFEGYWQTMSMKAGMTLRKDDFPYGFYIVFVMHGDDIRCKRSDDSDGEAQPLLYDYELNNDRIKLVEFVIREKITDIEYLAAIFGTGGTFVLVYIFVFIVSCTYSCRSSTPSIDMYPDNEISGEAGCSRVTTTHVPGTESDTTPGMLPPPQTNACHPPPQTDADPEESQHWLADSDSSLDETDIDFMDDANREKDVYRTSRGLCVAALARKNPRILAKKSQLYLYTLFTVAVFYALPVVQLVFTYQRVLHTTGNQDLCYYNYLCSHPLWLLSDFNHVYSNVGYIMLGLLFLLLVLRKERMHEKLALQDNRVELRCGIPRHFGLFYAMGFALIMEGILSACYHVCPNHSNFQFDTCFMYVNAILCMLKIYQTRHPDINASAYMAFTSLAFVVLLGVVGVMAGNLYFWITFTLFHVLFCMFMSAQIYYLGRWRLDCGVFRRIYHTWKNDCIAGPLACLTPLYLDRMVLLAIANICNWTIAGYGMWKMPQDFASHLLLIFMSNLFLHSNFYILMKLTHREKILCQPAIYIILSIVFWGLSLYVFIHRSTSWQLSPAESRTYNRECMLLRFYDTHDIWHFLSAFSMFFSFMILLTLDDDLAFVSRTKIAVF
ncbi:SID1 transmembrane family member 1 [Orchesella cincta]|uniref:SID1 transmembrane family member 1 n=1 Tax=Orchesella cincta TaxID=48709 RepID=A0A1D2M1A9_ORCCI|nr:SID1 transmembrane family member 1 [Orchesella cincta]